MPTDCLMPGREGECRLAFWCLDNNPAGILWSTLSGRIVLANAALHSMLGYSSNELVGKELTSLDTALKQSDIGSHGHITELVRSRQITEMSTSFRCADGAFISVQESISIPEGYLDRFVIFVRDTHQDIEMGDTMTGLVAAVDVDGKPHTVDELLTDQLTGTWLRWRFFEIASIMCKQACESKTPLCLLFLDIDRFKNINDQCGHNIGDGALREVVDAVSKAVRNGDLLFRWGGDEFVILLPRTAVGEARIIANRVRWEVEQRGLSIGLSLTISTGISSYQPGEEIVEEWVARADEAMYRAKKEGGNAVRE